MEDEFAFVDDAGETVADPARLGSMKLSVLLTRQFPSFPGSASDPPAALLRFEQLVKEVIAAPGEAGLVELLSSQKVLQDLAQLLADGKRFFSRGFLPESKPGAVPVHRLQDPTLAIYRTRTAAARGGTLHYQRGSAGFRLVQRRRPISECAFQQPESPTMHVIVFHPVPPGEGL